MWKSQYIHTTNAAKHERAEKMIAATFGIVTPDMLGVWEKIE